MEVLKEEMESDELHYRVNAIHRIKLISTILGVEGTKSILLPYLECTIIFKNKKELIKKEEDEVLFAIADSIYQLTPIMG
jgi:hypothetical protein